MKNLLRHRSLLVLVAPALVILALLLTDPDKGASTGIWVIRLVTGFVAIAVSHWAMKAMFDYGEADRQSLFAQVLQGNVAAGAALIAQAIVYVGTLMLFAGLAHGEPIPVQARPYLPVLSAQQHQFWGSDPRPELLGALIEHESACPRPSQCWNPRARLKSAREEGAGFGQITRAYRKDGSVRMDALEDMRQRHPALRDWGWENVYQRPDLQLRAVVLMARDDFMFFKRLHIEDGAALQFADAAYNGGAGGVQNDRRECRASAGCDPAQWFDQVELHCTKSRAAIYGQRSPCDINRHHVRDVFRRAPKYRGLLS